MTHAFDPAVVDAVLAHMNGDHLEDNLVIVRGHGMPEATAASMSDADGEAGTWTVDRALPRGTYTFEIVAVDAMGNRSATETGEVSVRG